MGRSDAHERVNGASVLSILSLAAGEGEVEFKVRDHGPGIPAYAEAKIFDRFFSLARPAGGKKSSGLGLSLVKEIMTLHGGRVEVVSHPDGGTVATLVFHRNP